MENKLKENINKLYKAFEGTEKIKFTKKKTLDETKVGNNLNSNLIRNKNKTGLLENDFETMNLNDYSLDKLLKPMLTRPNA